MGTTLELFQLKWFCSGGGFVATNLYNLWLKTTEITVLFRYSPFNTGIVLTKRGQFDAPRPNMVQVLTIREVNGERVRESEDTARTYQHCTMYIVHTVH
jgi:hypothetical protein